MTERLAFGLNGVAPDGVTVWGARLIWPNDLVWDRMDCIGDDRKPLADWLSSGAEVEMRDRLARLSHDDPTWTPRTNETRVIYDDGRGVVVANPRSSGGYVYVAAWLGPRPTI